MKQLNHPFTKQLFLCNGKSCSRNGAEDVTKAIRDEIRQVNAEHDIHTTKTLCNGKCQEGPIVIVYPEGIWYGGMTEEGGRKLIERIIGKTEQ
ncbi:(2Fe-2S) ferredoxin domain-containing protein [Priestia abyssalis]|uniref:(2Fe-2S) ferredoxin domain-containing protein n=1 Tax=Priestia abyssalis TaxID=1221450 RepID=UPI0014745A49|nr:(2Fe-2S) ferredoxin domain-containing protein [Priestia abyssalis]